MKDDDDSPPASTFFSRRAKIGKIKEEEDEDDHDDSPPVSFFSRRAKFVPKLSAEEFKAASKLIEEIKEESNECSQPKRPKPIPAKRKGPVKLLEETEDGLNTLASNGINLRKTRSQTISKDANLDLLDLVSSNEKCANPVDNIDLDDESEQSNLFISPAAKRQLTLLQKKHEKELRSIEDATQKVLSALNKSDSSIDFVDVEEEENSIKRVNVLTISYLTDISRLKCYEHEKFSTIFPKVADLFNLKASEFLLCLKEKNIQVNDTPKSLSISASDIIECIPYKVDGNSAIEYDENKLKLFFQASDTRVKAEIVVHKLEKMKDIMERYSSARNLSMDQLEFEFDGERICGTETPEDLDMESGSCVDVHVLSSDEKQRKQTNSKATSVVTLESDSNDSDIIFCD